MNGTLTSDSTENVVRPAENGNLTEFTITNTENTTNKVVIAGDKVVLTDEDNNVISESFIPEHVTSNTDEAKKVIITLMVGGKEEKQIIVDEGTTITEDLIKSNITVEEGYKIDGYYTDEAYTKEFDFTTALNSDVTIYVRIAEIQEEQPEETAPETDNTEKDDVPKTGVENYVGIAVLAMVFSISTLIYMKKTK